MQQPTLLLVAVILLGWAAFAGPRADHVLLEEAQAVDQGAPAAAQPCHLDSRYRNFDFWIGVWDVFDPSQNKVGTSRVELILDGCVLQEHWQSARGMAGRSVNVYSPSDDSWRQYWVASTGIITEYRGKFRNGKMQFEGESFAPDGTRQVRRMTFLKLARGRVRQLIESSADGGQTWQPWFDGTYVPAVGKHQP